MIKKTIYQNSRNSISVNKFLGNLFIIFSLLPWANFRLNNMDSQPWPFIFCIIFLLKIKRLELPPYAIQIFFLTIIGLMITVSFTNEVDIFVLTRALINFLSLPLLYIGYYNYFIRYGFPLKIFIFFNILWIVYGILELFIPEISGLITKNRTGSTRGVTSFANEATDFGIYLLFSSFILINTKNLLINNNIKKLLIINFLSTLFLAKSSMVMLIYFICLCFFLMFKFYYTIIDQKIFKKSLINSILLIFFLFVIFSLFKDVLDGSRLEYLFNDSLEKSIMEMIITDDSINARVESIYFSIVGSYKNFLLPGGLDSYIEMRREILSSMGEEIFFNRVESNKIMSWMGTLSYDLGIFGLLVLFLFFLASYRNYRGSIIYSLTLILILFTAIPLAFPLIPMLFTLMIYNKNYNSHYKLK